MVQRARGRGLTAAALAILAFLASPSWAAGPSPSPSESSATKAPDAASDAEAPDAALDAEAPDAASDGVGCGGRLAGRRIDWIASNRVGSTADLMARLTAPLMDARLGTESVVENRSGASGLVGYKATQAAVAEGKTVINVLYGAQTLIGAAQGRLPDPATGMDLLGQVAGSDYVWATGKDSPLETLDDLFAAARERPIIFAAYQPKGQNFTRMVGTTAVLGLDATWVTGYRHLPQIIMAAIRGEVDVAPVLYDDTQKGQFDSGDLRPLMTLKGTVHGPGFENVPAFAGPDGVAMARARELGRDLDETAADVAGLVALSDLGVLIAMPRGTDESLIPCMRATLEATFASPELKRDARALNSSMETLSADAAIAMIEQARGRLAKFTRMAEAAAARLSR